MTITTVKLSQLRLSPLNVRRTKPAEIEALADDILAHGLLQNLVGYELDGKVEVVAGGRRYHAMQLLKKRKSITGAYEVPVDIRSKEEAQELSLAENFQRESMHPADSVRAFASLRDNGMDAEEIAARFGQATSHVIKLLRLGSLAHALLDKLGKDELSLDAARALTLTEDTERQVEAFRVCGNHAHSIRRFLADGKVATGDALFRFVGRETYEGAGGTITSDLFASDGEGLADDPALLADLAGVKLGAIEELLRSEGWSSVETALQRPDSLYNLNRMYPGEAAPSAEQAEELAKIEAEMIALEGAEDSDEAWEALHARKDAVEDALRMFTDDQRATGGVIAYVDYHGEIQLFHYRKKAAAKPMPTSEEETSPYSASLASDLSRVKTQALQDAIANDPTLALDVLLDSLAAQLLHGQYGYDQAVVISPERALVEVDPAMMAQSELRPSAALLAERYGDIPSDSRFETIRAMNLDQKMCLLAALVAPTINATVPSGCREGERHRKARSYADEAQLELADCWSAPVALFDRMRKPALLRLLEDECGKEAAANCAKLKKGDLAAAVADRLPDRWLPAPLLSPQQAEEAVEVPDSADAEPELAEAA